MQSPHVGPGSPGPALFLPHLLIPTGGNARAPLARGVAQGIPMIARLHDCAAQDQAGPVYRDLHGA